MLVVVTLGYCRERRLQVSLGGEQVQKEIEQTKLENIRMHQQEVNLRLCMMKNIVKFLCTRTFKLITIWSSVDSTLNIRPSDEETELRVFPIDLLEPSNCPTIPISSGLSRFCLKIPNPDPICDRDRKNPDFDSCCDIFVKFS